MSNKYGLIEFPNEITGAGFFSNYFTVLSCIRQSISRGLIPYVNASNTWFNPTYDFKTNTVSDSSINPWDWWFVQNTEEKDFIPVSFDRGYIPHETDRFLSTHYMPHFVRLADEHCIIQPSILEEEDRLAKEYFEGKTTLGILARGTEMLTHHLEHQKVSIESWPKIVAHCLKNSPDVDNIFLVSDDRRIVESILDAYPQTKYLPDYFRTTIQIEEEFKAGKEPWWLNSPTGNPDHRRRLGEECLIQTRLLSRSQYLLGTYSGMTNAARFFKKGDFDHLYLI